jgi:hypothetical protein
MVIVTHGEVSPTEIAVSDAVSVRVRAPGIQIRWSTVEELPELAGVDAADDGGWAEAIAANDLEPAGAMAAEPLALEGVAAPMLTTAESDDAYVELRAVPPPDEGLLIMAETNGVVQWYLPVNAPQSMAGPMGVESDQQAELRFLIPRSTLSQPSLAGFGEEAGGAIVRFFRFKLIQELIDAPLTAVLSWIIDKVERKTKEEGFRFFDRDRDFPLVSPNELQAMSGQRVLLLTHGIFSSLRGAFAGFADPKNDLMQHLRGVYGNNIIGWDHWTVARTPLENADALLGALPPNIRPDIVSHSRGALVTRALLEHPSLALRRQSRFASVGKAIFVAGANQGSQLGSFRNLNRLLNVYSAVGSIPVLGAAGVLLKVVVGLLRVLAHGAVNLPSVEALSSDLEKNQFLRELNTELMTPTGEIVVVHANYDPSKGPLAGFLDLNMDLIFGAANDMVVPYAGAEVLDKWQQVATNFRYGTASGTQSKVMHTNFFYQPGVQDLLRQELV